MEESASDKHLPRICCFLFSDRATQEWEASGEKHHKLRELATGLTSSDMTKRRAQEWHVTRASKKIADECRVGNFRKGRDDADNEQIRKRLHGNLKVQAGYWRQAAGAFSKSVLSTPAKTIENATKVESKYTADQWFFGVIGDIDLEKAIMQVPIDRTVTDKTVLRRLKNRPRPVYPLPVPQDVHESFRAELRKYGVDLPSFRQWVDQRKGLLAKHFPDLVKRYESGQSLSTAVPDPMTVLQFDTSVAGQKRKEPAKAASARKKARARTLGGFMVDKDDDNDGDYIPEHDEAAEQAEDEEGLIVHDMAPPVPRPREQSAPVPAPHVETELLDVLFSNIEARTGFAQWFGLPTPPTSLPDREPRPRVMGAFPPDLPPRQDQDLNGESKRTQYSAEHVEEASNRQQILPTAHVQQDAGVVDRSPGDSKRDDRSRTEAVKQEPAEVIVLDDDHEPEDRKVADTNQQAPSQQHGLPIPSPMRSIFPDGATLQNETVASFNGFNIPTNQDAASHIGRLQLDISRRMRKAYPKGCKLELELGGYEYVAVLERKGDPKPKGFGLATSERNADEVEDGHLNVFEQTKAAYANGHKTKFSLGDYNYTTIMRKLGSTEQA